MRKIITLSAIMIMTLSLMVPLAYGSTLNITLYPNKNLANVDLKSESELLFTYPNGSIVSEKLNGTSTHISFSETFNHPSDNAIAFMAGYLKSRYQNVTVDNMTVIFNLNEKANNTTLNITKNVSINLNLTGIFNKTKSETKVNLSWRAFEIRGPFDINGHDINDFGSYFGSFGMFLNLMDRINNHSTINFTALSTPLDKWNRIYDPSTNTTTFYYNSSMNVLLYMSINGTGMLSNAGNYTLKILYDPSSTIKVPGYATATNNSIEIMPTAPSTMNFLLIGIVAVVAVVVVVGGIALVLRKK